MSRSLAVEDLVSQEAELNPEKRGIIVEKLIELRNTIITSPERFALWFQTRPDSTIATTLAYTLEQTYETPSENMDDFRATVVRIAYRAGLLDQLIKDGNISQETLRGAIRSDTELLNSYSQRNDQHSPDDLAQILKDRYMQLGYIPNDPKIKEILRAIAYDTLGLTIFTGFILTPFILYYSAIYSPALFQFFIKLENPLNIVAGSGTLAKFIYFNIFRIRPSLQPYERNAKKWRSRMKLALLTSLNFSAPTVGTLAAMKDPDSARIMEMLRQKLWLEQTIHHPVTMGHDRVGIVERERNKFRLSGTSFR